MLDKKMLKERINTSILERLDDIDQYLEKEVAKMFIDGHQRHYVKNQDTKDPYGPSAVGYMINPRTTTIKRYLNDKKCYKPDGKTEETAFVPYAEFIYDKLVSVLSDIQLSAIKEIVFSMSTDDAYDAYMNGFCSDEFLTSDEFCDDFEFYGVEFANALYENVNDETLVGEYMKVAKKLNVFKSSKTLEELITECKDTFDKLYNNQIYIELRMDEIKSRMKESFPNTTEEQKVKMNNTLKEIELKLKELIPCENVFVC